MIRLRQLGTEEEGESNRLRSLLTNDDVGLGQQQQVDYKWSVSRLVWGQSQENVLMNWMWAMERRPELLGKL